MCEVKVESRTRVEEHGRTVLYEKIYRGVPTQGGGLRLLAYYERRIPLARMQMELRAAGHEKEWKGAARAARTEGKEQIVFLALFYPEIKEDTTCLSNRRKVTCGSLRCC